MSVSIQKSNISSEQEFDIVSDKQELAVRYKGSPEVDKISSEIAVYEPNSIIKFGSKVTEEISKSSDAILNNVGMDKLNDAGTMLKSLNDIMDEFNLAEITEDPKGIKKFFGGLHKQLEKIVGKYDTLGKKVDSIYVQLKQFESEIQASNAKLNEMFNANVDNYRMLELYILAGEQGIQEIDIAIAEKEKEVESNPDASFDLQQMRQARELLDQRISDLRVAEQVALQSVPMIKTMEFSNMNLIRKIDSAFIITLPVFKQAIAQAVLLKRQKIQAESLALLDSKTNELLIKNAQNTASNSVAIMQQASQSSIKIETLEETYKTIMQGIADTKRVNDEATQKRLADKSKLEQMKLEFNKTYALPNKEAK